MLRKGTTVIDVIGQIGFDPGTEWGTGSHQHRRQHAESEGNDLPGRHQRRRSCSIRPSSGTASRRTPSTDLGAHTANCNGVDVAPAVQTTVPADGATGVAPGADIAVTFSEAVNVAGVWFTISCTTSGAHTATVSGGPTAFTLNPDADFAGGESCTVTIVAANVTDQDVTDPPDNMAADTAFSFTTAVTPVCGDPATAIHDIQGSGATTPLPGATNVTIEGVVVGDYQGAGQLSGYYVQEEDADADADPATSEGIFVFNTSFAVARRRPRAGDRHRERVPGRSTIAHAADHGQLHARLRHRRFRHADVGARCPSPALGDWERYEGMLVTLPQTADRDRDVHARPLRRGQPVGRTGGCTTRRASSTPARRRWRSRI